MDVTRHATEEWPVLRSAQESDCDGRNPRSDEPCVLGYHQGPHRDEAGDEWLDDGDLARPDWLQDSFGKRA